MGVLSNQCKLHGLWNTLNKKTINYENDEQAAYDLKNLIMSQQRAAINVPLEAAKPSSTQNIEGWSFTVKTFQIILTLTNEIVCYKEFWAYIGLETKYFIIYKLNIRITN